MKILFVCLFGRDRSATAAALYHNLDGIEAQFGGVHGAAKVPVTPTMVQWAELIVCFQTDHIRALSQRWTRYLVGKEVLCLQIQNRYARGSRQLQDRIIRELAALRPDLPVPRPHPNQAARTVGHGPQRAGRQEAP